MPLKRTLEDIHEAGSRRPITRPTPNTPLFPNFANDVNTNANLGAPQGAGVEISFLMCPTPFEDGRLTVRWSSFHAKLEHYHYDTFDAAGERRLPNEQAQFLIGAGGDVASMKFLGVDFRKTNE